jgi:hypothetical protein
MIIGGVLCRPDCEREFVADMADRLRLGSKGWCYEWKNVRDRNIQQYEKIVDLFFEYNSEHCLDFSCLVVDCNAVDHDAFNDGDWDKGFNKFLYQHLAKHYRSFGAPSQFRCYHDRRGSRYDLNEIKRMLNFKYQYEGMRIVSPYREVSYSDKLVHPLLQIADILIGAVGYAWNDKLRQFPDGVKTRLCEHVRRRAALHDLATRTFFNATHFSIWEFRLDTKPTRRV